MSVNIILIPFIAGGFMMDSGSSTPLLLILPLLHDLINVLFFRLRKHCCSFFHWACETATPSGRWEYLCWGCMVFALMWRSDVGCAVPEGTMLYRMKQLDFKIVRVEHPPSYSAPRKQATSPKYTCDVQHSTKLGITWQWSLILKLKGKKRLKHRWWCSLSQTGKRANTPLRNHLYTQFNPHLEEKNNSK